jgi:hypothetical protein
MPPAADPIFQRIPLWHRVPVRPDAAHAGRQDHEASFQVGCDVHFHEFEIRGHLGRCQVAFRYGIGLFLKAAVSDLRCSCRENGLCMIDYQIQPIEADLCRTLDQTSRIVRIPPAQRAPWAQSGHNGLPNPMK